MGFPIVKDRITIPFLAFADDIIIFGKAQQAACQTIRNIIDDYCGISGQCVNYHKSSFQTTAKVTNQTKMTINAILNIPHSISLDKYLGYPIINWKVNKKTFKDVIINTKNQLTKWKASSLSQEGRATLIRSNFSAKPNFLMQSFMLPTSIHEKLDRTNRIFYWNKGNRHSPL